MHKIPKKKKKKISVGSFVCMKENMTDTTEQSYYKATRENITLRCEGEAEKYGKWWCVRRQVKQLNKHNAHNARRQMKQRKMENDDL